MISVKDQYESTFSGRSYLMNKIPASDIFQYQRLSTANSELPTALQETFDKLADETIAWSRYYYGSTMVSYSILMRLVEDGWTKK